MEKLRERIRSQEPPSSEAKVFSFWESILPYILPLLGPLAGFIIVIAIAPCLINRVTRFVRAQISQVKVMVLRQQYDPLPIQAL